MTGIEFLIFVAEIYVLINVHIFYVPIKKKQKWKIIHCIISRLFANPKKYLNIKIVTFLFLD